LKLEMSLPERPGLLHAVPVLDIFALLWLLFLLGPSLLRQSGLMVELPPSRFQLERFQNTLVVTLGPGESEPRIHFGRDSVDFPELDERLETLRKEGAAARSMVLLQTDAGTPVGTERQVTEMVLAKGFRLAMVGANQAFDKDPGTDDTDDRDEVEGSADGSPPAPGPESRTSPKPPTPQ
jgi:Biopolymer transport protein ExbD/TolR